MTAQGIKNINAICVRVSDKCLQEFLNINIAHGEWARAFVIANEIEKREHMRSKSCR